MQIDDVRIHNFRGILEASFKLYEYSLLIGANNSGKTTVIDAIRIFYELDNYKFDKSRDLPFVGDQNGETWVEITFKLSDEEFGSLASEYKGENNLLRIRKYLQTKDKEKSGSFFGYKNGEEISDTPFYGTKNVGLGKFGDVIYIPATSKVDDHAKLTGPSVLRNLLTNLLQDVVENNTSFNDFQNQFEIFSSSIREEKTPDGYSLTSVENDLNTMISSWGTTFSLKISSPSTGDIIKSMINFDFQDNAHGKPQSIERFGTGFQRHFIYSLIQTGAKYIVRKPAKGKKEFQPEMTLILFEEPEAFLHPSQQENLSKNLMKLAKNSTRQVICSTHSPCFVSRNTNNIPSLIKLNRGADGVIKINQIDHVKWERIVDSNQAIRDMSKYPKLSQKLTEDDLKNEMEVLKYSLWLNSERCCMFFSDMVLLVEGTTESSLIAKLIDEDMIGCEKSFFVLDCLGKYNIHRFMNLLASLGIKHAVICDDDNNKNEHDELNKLIEESRNNFTISIKFLPHDLEKFLELSASKSPYSKPQHALYQYENKRINTEKINDFCRIVEEALSG